MSSTLITEISRGTRKPCSCRQRMAAMAVLSLAQKMAEGEMQGTSLTGAEKKLLVQILQRAANKNSEMQPAVDELKKLWKESS